MKKSEAVKKINNWLDNSPEITGESLLDFLQNELGMNPPFSDDKFFESFNKNGRNASLANGYNWDDELNN